MYNYKINYKYAVDDKTGKGFIEIKLKNKLYAESKNELKIRHTKMVFKELEEKILSKHIHDFVKVVGYELLGENNDT